MNSLPDDILHLLRKTLRQCVEFEDDDKIKALFDEKRLKTYQDGLLSILREENLDWRVNLTISYLLEKSHPARGDSSLSLFIRGLSERRSLVDPLRQQLIDLADQVRALDQTSGTSVGQLAPHAESVVTSKKKLLIGIISIREDEYTEILRLFPATRIYDGRNERRYRLTSARCVNKETVDVAITRCLEQGNIESEKAAMDLLTDLNPDWILVVGIAGGVPDSEFSLGDVLVSSRVHDLTLESSSPGGAREYSIKGGDLHPLAKKVVQDIPGALENELKAWHKKVKMKRPTMDVNIPEERLSGDNFWNKKIRESIKRNFGELHPPKIKVGAIASSDRMIKDPTITARWKSVARHFCGVEMELAGVCRAAVGKPVLGIRGISDIVGLIRDDVWTPYACKTAAAFAFALVTSSLLPGEHRGFSIDPVGS